MKTIITNLIRQLIQVEINLLLAGGNSKKNRYTTINHPSITTQEKCAFKVETILSPQENQTLEGLTRTLQISQRDAIRIAIYELGKDVLKAENLLKYAEKENKKRGHTSRNLDLPIRVIKVEKKKKNSRTI